jgi:hypothetical protein
MTKLLDMAIGQHFDIMLQKMLNRSADFRNLVQCQILVKY